MKPKQDSYVIGVDFGTDSARAILLSLKDGETLAKAEAKYPRWSAGKYQEPENKLFRQHPLDYLEALQKCISDILSMAGPFAKAKVAGLGVCATGSTPCPVDPEGTPLSLLPDFSENVDAMFHLWKDHTASHEAEKINAILSNCEGQDFTKYQGKYISEWYWSKILHAYHSAPEVAKKAATWMELCDWIPNLLTGRRGLTQLYRSACAAGHKALWHSAWGGLPNRSCLVRIHPYLGQIHDSYSSTPMAADQPAGVIVKIWAEKLGLPETLIVGGSSLDAHAGAVGVGIQPGVMVVSLGTSTVNILVEEPERLADKQLTHVCGQAENSVLPGLVGLETSQAAFGDVYRWFQDLLMWPIGQFLKTSPDLSSAHRETLMNGFRSNLLRHLTAQAEALPIEGALTALDWFNGRRYPHADENLKSAIVGLDLGSGAPEIFQGLVLGTVLGQKRIIDELEKGGVRVRDILAVGGISRKSPYIMQTLADVLHRSIKVCRTTHASARGGAMYAAVGCGAYKTISAAGRTLAGKVIKVYKPDASKFCEVDRAYQRYLRLGKFVENESAF